MKTTWDELMRYAPEKEYPLPALERGEQERILNKTMKKLEKTKKRPARPVRPALLAAAIAALLCGTHDYTSFCANRRMKKSAVRTVNAITVERLGEEVRLTFSGDGFLYHMVRILTGTLLEVGLGQRDAGTMPDILAARDRSAAGPAAPARGLILWETRY